MKKISFLAFNILMVYLLFGLAAGVAAALDPVMKTSPTNGQTGVSLIPTLQWQKVSGANAYEIIIKNYPGDTAIWDVFIADASSKKVPAEILGVDKSYEWCVRGIKTETALAADKLYSYQEVESLMVDYSPQCSPRPILGAIKAGEYSLFSTGKSETTLKTPTISSPKGLTTFPLILKWSSVGSSFKYQWEITGTKTETLANGEVVITKVTGLPSGQVSGTQVEVTDPSNSLSILKKYAYTWRVKTCTADYSSCGDWASASFSLTLKKFHLVSPKDNTPTATVVKLDWEDVPGAASYRVMGEGFDPVNVSKNESFTTISGLILDATYKWYVIAKRDGEEFISEEQDWSFTPRSGVAPPTTPPPTGVLAAPQLSSPADNAKDVSLTPTFTWRSVTGANLYKLQILGPTPIEIKAINTQANLSQLKDEFGTPIYTLKDGSSYSWQVRASKDNGETWSDPSTPYAFTTKGVPPAGVPARPSSLSPCGRTGVSSTPTLSWKDVKAKFYNVIITGFPYLEMIFGTSVKIDYENVGFSLQSGQTYNWWVQACNDVGCSSSDICQITIKSATTGGGTSGGTSGGSGGIFSVSEACQSEASDCPEGQICNPLKYKSIECLVEAITNFLIKLSVPAAVIMFVISGIMFVTSAGDPEKVRTARRVMIYTAVGFAVILVASGLIKVLQSLLGGS